MNSKYIIYALLVTVVTTGVNWANMLGSSSKSSSGSSWASRGAGFGGGGGGHK
jgi:hypothetical protein